MPSTLTERYIYAVIRSLPEGQRADVAAELRASIADQRDDRAGAGESAEVAERTVLTALGDPDALAAGYVDRPLHLIGPRYFLTWKRLVALLLWIVVPLSAGGIALGLSLSGEDLAGIIGATIGGSLSVAVHLVFWTTLVFALIERSDSASASLSSALPEWSVDQLPADIPGGGSTGARFIDMVWSLLFLAAGAAALVWDQLVGLVHLEGRWMSFLSPDMWPWWAAGLLAMIAAEAILMVVVHVRGRWTFGLALWNALIALIVGAGAIWLLSQGSLLNEEFWATVIPESDGAQVFGIVSVITGCVIGGVAVWDAIDTFLKARRSR